MAEEPQRLTLEYDGSRNLNVIHHSGDKFRVQASSESGNPAAKRTSKTFRWEYRGKQYRVQVQVTDAE